MRLKSKEETSPQIVTFPEELPDDPFKTQTIDCTHDVTHNIVMIVPIQTKRVGASQRDTRR